MNCNSFEEWIALYVEGDLDPARATHVESHLKVCASCQSLLSRLEGSQAMVKDLAAESLDPASFNVVRERVMQKVHRRQARPVWWQLLSPAAVQRPAWAAAALATAVALGFLMQWQLWRKPADLDKPGRSAVASSSDLEKEHPEASVGGPPQNTTSTSARPSTEPAARRTRPHGSATLEAILMPVAVEPEAIPTESEPPVEQGSNLVPEALPPADVSLEPPPPLVIKLVTDDPNVVIVWLVDQEIRHD